MQTLLGYAYDFHVFWDSYLQPRQLTLRDVTPDVLRGFFAFLRRGYEAAVEGKAAIHRVNSNSGLARKRAALRGIFAYLTHSRHLYEHDPSAELSDRRARRRGGAVHRPLPVFLSESESLRLKENMEHGGRKYRAYQRLNLRDFTIITLFIAAGLRVSELVALTLHSFDPDLTLVRVIGKGNKPRVVPLSAEARAVLQAYIADRRGHEGVPAAQRDLLFLNRQNQPLTRKGVHDIVRLYCDRAGLFPNGKPVSPHKLRHTAATNWYRKGLDLYMLQQVLGHANPATTEIYTHVTPREVLAAVRRIDEGSGQP